MKLNFASVEASQVEERLQEPSGSPFLNDAHFSFTREMRCVTKYLIVSLFRTCFLMWKDLFFIDCKIARIVLFEIFWGEKFWNRRFLCIFLKKSILNWLLYNHKTIYIFWSYLTFYFNYLSLLQHFCTHKQFCTLNVSFIH